MKRINYLLLLIMISFLLTIKTKNKNDKILAKMIDIIIFIGFITLINYFFCNYLIFCFFYNS